MPIIRQIIDKPICGNCGSGQVYFVQRGTIIVCRICGVEEKINRNAERENIGLLIKKEEK